MTTLTAAVEEKETRGEIDLGREIRRVQERPEWNVPVREPGNSMFRTQTEELTEVAEVSFKKLKAKRVEKPERVEKPVGSRFNVIEVDEEEP